MFCQSFSIMQIDFDVIQSSSYLLTFSVLAFYMMGLCKKNRWTYFKAFKSRYTGLLFYKYGNFCGQNN